jgi:hypothetical protein
MKRKIGLWIDHREAVIVRVFDEGEITNHLPSHLPKRVRFSGVSHDKAELNPHDDHAEDKRDRRFEELLAHYYDEVIQELMAVDYLFIMGPGESKYELEKHIEESALRPVQLIVETADKMTDNQIVAKVRQHFTELQHPTA